ncbi:oligosaccharyl transferase, archaeosortase A system-associated [Methanoculleus sp. FWC-SCC1]|uniref:dolichyl-phosphooligosaccharide-protein glycotransferase n=1 Tax=Methanoculleus frigidifontis TaxID=2584085 RepID=A0ABT8MAS6_9EURY|nr:oligosaccharyl transferase, archaeosortase A system-associated [Methanoculleus sp. FWC-SCC1]MDN7025044.1 oligosaccharyl transferase, archaeosortase A system-associated [Methanoculleus sp. FWC-SCC1]
MALAELNKYRTYVIIGLLIILSAFALWIRALSADQMITAAGVDLLGNDPWYNLRQVEQMVANFPEYAWFDAMTYFPYGETIYWGPLFISIISTLSLLAGAATRPEIMVVASWVPPLMAAAMVPVMYGIGAKMADWKTGLLSAGFIAVVSGAYLYRSLFGFVDHHIAEVLFSTLFVLAYIVAIGAVRSKDFDIRHFETLKAPAVAAVLAGIAYLLGLYTMPTMVLFALIVAIFTLVQFVWDYYRGRTSEYLVFLNLVVFGVAILGMFVVGIQHAGLSLSQYSIMHVIAYLAVILGTFLLYGLAAYLQGKPKYLYPASLVGIAVLAFAVVAVALPDFFAIIMGSIAGFFGSEAITTTVQEARAWSFTDAVTTFHWGLLLLAGGFVTLIYRNWREEHPAQIFVLIWSAVILYSTIAHVRYEYYLAANIALLAAIFIGFVLDAGWGDIRRLFGNLGEQVAEKPDAADENSPEPGKKKKKGAAKQQKPKAAAKHQPDFLKVGMVAVVVVVGLVFAGQSLTTDMALSSSVYLTGMDSQWQESLEWFGANTPETGVDYYAIYDQTAYTYPDEAYGVMSWWDYGHWITFISKRIPNANPFQRGVIGPNGAGVYFTTTSEETANVILDTLGTRYVITDIQMDTGKFHAMATWANATVGNTPFEPYFLVPAEAGSTSYNQVPLRTQDYYETTVSRLHNFDGSMTDPSSAIYVEYREGGVSGSSLPVVTRAERMAASDALAAAEQYNRNAAAGTRAGVFNDYNAIYAPVERVPALQHYRLVHESPQNVFSGGASVPDIKYVKIFEYVPGAKIRGEGVIEVPIVTNTGRTFTYRQESASGEFVVPYATTDGSGEVTATGPYQIAGTALIFDVTEDDIAQGRYIN